MKRLLLLLLFAAPLYAQPLLPHSSLTGYMFVTHPGAVIVTVQPINSPQLSPIDTNRDSKIEVLVWRSRPSAGNWSCAVFTMLVDPKLPAAQKFTIDPGLWVPGDGIGFESRTWYSIDLRVLDAKGTEIYPGPDCHCVNPKLLLPALFVAGTPSGWQNCGGVEIVPPRRRASKPPSGDPCKP